MEYVLGRVSSYYLNPDVDISCGYTWDDYHERRERWIGLANRCIAKQQVPTSEDIDVLKRHIKDYTL